MFVEVFRIVVKEFLNALAMSRFEHQIRRLPIHAGRSLKLPRGTCWALRLLLFDNFLSNWKQCRVECQHIKPRRLGSIFHVRELRCSKQRLRTHHRACHDVFNLSRQKLGGRC